MNGLQQRKLLIVDDEPDLRAIIAETMRDLGAEVLEANGAIEALSLIAQAGPVDAIITDMAMPQGDGKALIQQVRTKNLCSTIVLVSGNIALEDELELIQSVTSVFSKPCNWVTVAQVIAAALAAKYQGVKRRFLRTDTEGALRILAQGSNHWVEAQLANISLGGMFAQMRGPLPAVGSRIAYNITDLSGPNPVTEGHFICRWTRAESQSDKPRGVGLQYLSLNDQLRLFITSKTSTETEEI